MLFEKVSCSWKKTGSIHSGVVSHLRSGQEKKEQVEMRGAASARWHIQLIIDDLIHYTLKGKVLTPAEIDSGFIHFFLGRGVNAVGHKLSGKRRGAHDESVLNYLLTILLFTI